MRLKGEAKADAWRAAKAEWKASMAQHRTEMSAAWTEWKATRRAVRGVPTLA